MPQAIPVVAAVAANAYPAYAALIYAVAAAATYATTQHQRRKQAKKARDAYNSALEDRLVMGSTANGPRSRIYGECRNVDGVIFKGTHGANSQYYTMVVALAGHQSESIEKVYFNDQEVELESDGAGGYWVVTEPYRRRQTFSATETMVNSGGGASVTLPFTPIAESLNGVALNVGGDGSPPTFGPETFSVVGNTVSIAVVDPAYVVTVTYQYLDDRPKARVWKYLGTDAQDIGSDLLASRFPTLINTGTDPNTGLPNDDRFAGITALAVELEYDQEAFPTGLPNVTALVRGVRLLDPRTDSTAWSRNPSLIARDWSLYARGGACSAAEVPDAMVEAAANACDTSTDFETPTGTETRPLYQCDIVCRLDVPPDQHLDEIIESMAGKQGWAGGVKRWVAGAYRPPVADITEDWVTEAESIVIVPQPARTELVNVYRPSIFSAEPAVDSTTGQTAAYTLLPLPEVRSAEYIAADGEELPSEVTLGGVQHNVHAQHICGVLMRDAHEGLVIKLPCNMRAWVLELFDTVTLTLPTFGFDATEFEVIGWTFSVDKGVILTLKMTGAAIFDPDAEFNDIYTSPNSSLVLPWVVPAIENFAVEDAPEDGTQQCRALVTWDAITTENVRQSGHVEVQYRRVTSTYSEDDWQSWMEAGSSVSTIVPGLNSDAIYMFRARAVNTLRVRGEWCQQLLYSPSVPLIGSPQIEPGAATEYLFDTPADFTWNTPTADPRGVLVQNLADITYTNTDDEDVLIEFVGTANITHENEIAAPNDDLFYWDAWTTGVGTGTRLGGRLIARQTLADNETKTYSVTLVFRYVLPAGDTATFSIYTTLEAPTTDAEAADIDFRAVVIKR